MKVEIKILTILTKTTKDGRAYKEVWYEVTFDGQAFVRKQALFTR